MEEQAYFRIISDPEESQEAIEEAHVLGTITDYEYNLLGKVPEELTVRELEQALEVLAKAGVLGKVGSGN